MENNNNYSVKVIYRQSSQTYDASMFEKQFEMSMLREDALRYFEIKKIPSSREIIKYMYNDEDFTKAVLKLSTYWYEYEWMV